MLASNLQQKVFKLLLKVLVLSVFVFYFVQIAQIAFAQANPQINYQGKLTNSLGVAVPDGTYNMNFWLVASGTAATSTAVWSEALTGVNKVQVTNGLFSVMLGSTTALTGVDFNQTLFLGVEIGGTSTPAWDGEMSPRKILGTVPAAFVANYATVAGAASSSDSTSLLGGVASSSFLRSDEADTMEATSSSPILSIIQNGAGAIARFFSGITEVFTILNNGNVGVGTSTPSTDFTVDGDVLVTGNSTLGNTSISTLSLGTALSAVNGGTGLSSVTQNQLLIGGAGNTWTQISTSSLGLVTGPSSSVDNSIVRFNGTTGKIIQDYTSGAPTVSDTGDITVKNLEAYKISTANTDFYNISNSTAVNILAYSPVSKYLWHDVVAFNNTSSWGVPGFEVYSGSWSSSTLQNGIFAQKEDSVYTIIDGVTDTAARWTWDANNVSYSQVQWVMFGITYNASAASKDFLVESSADGSAWTTRHTSSGNTAQAQPILLKTDAPGGDRYFRVTVTVTNSQPLKVSSLKILSPRWGDQGGGSEYEYPYKWDGDWKISFGSSSSPANGIVTIGSNTTDSAGGLYFGTDTNLYRSAANKLMTDDDLIISGTLGIGTTTPGSLLTVAGTANITGATTLGSTLNVTGATTLTTASSTALTATTLYGTSAQLTNASTTHLSISGNSYLGTVLSGTWQGSAIGALYGGTGLTSYSTGDLIYASGANTLANRIIGSTGDVLMVSGGVPTWTGTSTLGLGNGTFLGLTDTPSAYTANRILYQSGAAVTDNANFTFDGSQLAVNGDIRTGYFTATSSTATSTFTNAYFSGSVGIGTTTPTQALEIVGNIKSSATIWASGGNATLSQAAISANRATTVTMGNVGAGNLEILAGGATGITLLANGNVGIGTTTPAARLTIQGVAGSADLLSLASSTGDRLLAVTNTGSLHFGSTGEIVFDVMNNDGDNVAIGRRAFTHYGPNSWDAGSNIAIGLEALYGSSTDLMTGTNNTAFGQRSMYSNVSGGGNFATGLQTLYDNVSGSYNAAIGIYSLANNISGNDNIALGRYSLQGNTVGSFNVAIGSGDPDNGDATLGNSTGSYNVAVGTGAFRNYVGDSSVALGYRAGNTLTNGNRNIIIGYNVDFDSASTSLGLNIGNLIYGIDLNGTGTTKSTGNIGIGTSTPSSKLTVVGDFYATGAFRDSSNASGTQGMILQTTGTSTRWVATSTLGLGNNTFLGLTDTPSSYTANRMLFVNSAGNAVTSSSSLVFDGTNLSISGQVVSAGNVWTSRATTTSAWQAITYGNGRFVAVGSAGAIYTSPDGINWTTRSAAEANTWRSVTYGNGFFVAVSSDGTNRVMTSPDGITWTARSATEANIWRSVTYGNNLFVAISYNGTNRVMTSPDGITWTARSAAEANPWTGVTYGNGLFVAVSYIGTNRVMTSPDGVNWTARSAAAANNWMSVTYGNGLFVAVSENGTYRGMTSPDGINWTSQYITPSAFSSVTYGNGLFVTVGQSGITGPSISTDGIAWTEVLVPENNLWTGVTYGNGVFVAVSINGTNRVMTSGKSFTNALAHNNVYQGGTSFMGGLRAGTTSTSVAASIFLQSEAGKNPFAVASSSGAELLSLSQSGALGIGTSSPIARYLDVGPIGSVAVIAPLGTYMAGIHQQSAVAADDTLLLSNSGGISRTSSIQFRGSSNVNGGAFSTARIVAGAGTGYTSSYLTLGSSNGNNSFNSELTLKNGLVGIGTSTPSATLTIAGSGSNNPFNIASSTGASLLALTQTGALGLGTSSPYALGLTIERTGISGTTTAAGIGQYLTFSNSVASAQQFANNTYIKTTNTATTTLVGSIIRLEDSTTLGNTVRGFEVQTERGNNTLGENTAISGFARTFGVRGVTEGDAGGTYEPAGIYGETRGTTQSNAIRGYSSTITTSSLLKLFQDTSTFEGTGLLMNFGNSGGSFSSTTASHFIDLKNAGTTRFKVGAYGMLTIGDGSTTTNAGIQIGYGGLCVDNDGSCNASTTGRISSVSTATGNSDLAEMYFSNEDLLPGEIVYLKEGLSVGRAATSTRSRILGVVSTLPGVIMGENDTSLVVGEIAHPIALKGRVPVRLSNENGDIKAGDDLMLSSIPGVAMKASSTGKVIGTALEDFVSSRAYSDTYINQFGESIVVPVYTPISRINDPRVNDGCYFGGGNASGEEICVPLTATTTEAQYDEADEIAAREAKEAALRAMRRASSEEMNIGEGKTVQVGQIVMFVDLKYRYLDEAGEEMIAALLSKASTTENNSTTETIWQRLVNLANNFIDGVLRVFTLKADRVETSQLCVDGVCVNASDLRNLLEASNNSVQVIEIVEVISDQNIVDDTGTTTATSTDDTTEETTDETGEEELEEVEEVEAEAGPGSEIIPGPEPEPIPEPEVEIAPEPEISPPVTANTT